MNLGSCLHAHDNRLAIAAAVSDFLIPKPSAIKFHTGAAFLPHLAKPKTSSNLRKSFLVESSSNARECLLHRSKSFRNDCRYCDCSIFQLVDDNAYTKHPLHRLIV